MKGGWLHNHLLVERVLQCAGPLAIVRREVRVDTAIQRSRSVDAIIDWPHLRAVLEAGNSEARVLREVAKARDLDAGVLLIVTPTPTVTRRVRAALRREKLNKSDLSIIVLSQGAACQWVANQSLLMSAMHVLRTSDNKPHQSPREMRPQDALPDMLGGSVDASGNQPAPLPTTPARGT
jgi:hypothetical protein